MDDKPPRRVRFGHSAAEESWPPKPVERRELGAGNPSVPPEPKRHVERLSWIWKGLGVIGGCVVFGWSGHATMAAWSARWQTTEGAAQDRERIEKIERDRDGLALKVHDMDRDLAKLLQDFAEYRNQHPDTIPASPTRSKPR